MKKQLWVVAVGLVVILGVTACSDTDDLIDLPVNDQAEAAVEGALVDVVGPLSDFMEGIADAIFNAQPKAAGLQCPPSQGVCSSGAVMCDADSSGVGLDFDFDSCNLTEAMILVDGGVNFTATGETSFIASFESFSVDGSSPISGSVSFDGSTCSQNWAITTADGVGVLGTITGCGEHPSANSLLAISVNAGGNLWYFTFTFDGSGTANVVVERNEELVSICEVDLDTFATTCFNPADI